MLGEAWIYGGGLSSGLQNPFHAQLGKRKDVKKAYVTLEEGNTIDVSTGL